VALGWLTICGFSFTFFSPVLFFVLMIPYLWKRFPWIQISIAMSLALSYLMPLREWPWFRRIGQLWYEVFDFHCNMSEEKILKTLKVSEEKQLILAMHPHGIVPYQAILWAAYCDQYITHDGKHMYGFGAAADAVGYIPFLRNIMGFLTAGSASYKPLKSGLTKKRVPAAGNREVRNLFILPGGVAEIFLSKPGSHDIVFKKRKGLIRLAVETGAMLCPCYVFGGTDFFQNLATDDGIFAAISRKLRLGLTIFWGQFGLPIPFAVKVTMIVGDPIPTPKLPENCTEEQKQAAIEELHATFIKEIEALFNKYKGVSGYPDAKLNVL
jgi:2-acylglycerol O-acyltransferase 2